MIPRRFAWLLRDTTTLFDGPGFDGLRRCRLCSGLERGHVRLARPYLERHLADHRREKIVADEPAPSLTVAGALDDHPET